MSVISEKVRIGLYTKMDVPGVKSLATSGIFESVAPDGTEPPYVIMQRQAPGRVTYAFGLTQVLEDDIWVVKTIVDKDSSTTQSPQALAESILAACLVAIGASMTISGNTVVFMARLMDIPPFQQAFGDRTLYTRGFMLRVATS